MNTLPPVEYNEKHPSITYSVNDTSQYDEFLEEFTAYVSGDCHAITIDDEILYNSYDYNEKSVREIIQEKAIRGTIINDPHSIFVQLFIEKRNSKVILYMFGNTPWFVCIYYNALLHTLTLEYYKSKKYEEVWESK